MSSEVRKAVQALPSAFLPEKAGSAVACFQLDFSGDGEGRWVLDVSNGRCEVRQQVAENPDVTVTMAGSDFVAMLNDQLDPVQAFMGGKIKISGNLGLVMQFLNWFERGS
jgi:putative sterol carrier protein